MAKVTVDFTNVKERGDFNPKHIPEGEYRAKITKAEVGESKSGNSQLVLSVTLDEHRSATYPYYCGLVENQLWKLRNVLLAAGMPAPKKRVTLDPQKLVGKTIAVEMVDDEYEGRMKSVINSVFSPDDLTDEDLPDDDDEDTSVDDDEDDEEDEPEPPKKAKKAKAKPRKKAPVEDDDDEDDEIDLDEI